MGRYQAYPEYKDSGVDWLGGIPIDWTVIDLKRHVWVKTGYAFASESFVDDGEPIIRIGDIQQDGSVSLDSCKYITLDLAKQHSNYLVYSGELVMAMTGATIGKAGWYKYETPALVNQRVGVFKTNINKINYRFLWFILKSAGYQEYIKLTAFGGAQPNISDIGMVGYKTVLPSLKEQHKIANFLDHETAKIDTLIEKQQQLIQLLKEKRQAVISHAVTKGLNPDATMKNSGVEWLGEVPEHWVVRRLKHSANLQSGIPKGKDLTGRQTIEVPMLRVANVQDGYLDLNDISNISIEPHELSRYLLSDGDVLMNEGGDNDKLGRGAVWRNEITPCIHQNHVFAIRPIEIEPDWLDLVTRASYAKFHFYRVAKQSTNLASISSTNIKETPLVIPPESERVEIMEYIRTKMTAFEALETKSQIQVRLLQERRTALISAAVTGKIDVRNWQAPQI